jgi:hypothetical protein
VTDEELQAEAPPLDLPPLPVAEAPELVAEPMAEVMQAAPEPEPQPLPVPTAPVETLIASTEGPTVVFSLDAPTKVRCCFETTGLPKGTLFPDRYLGEHGASLLQLDVAQDLNRDPPIFAPRPVPIVQGQMVALTEGTYELKVWDLRTCRFLVYAVEAPL